MSTESHLAWKAEACRDAGDGSRDEVVEVTVGRSGQLEGPEADVIQSLVVNAERLVRVLDQLVDRQSRVVRLHDHIRHLHHRKSIIQVHFNETFSHPTPALYRRIFDFWPTIWRVITPRMQKDTQVLNKKMTLKFEVQKLTRSVAAGFGRHAMPPPDSNDTGTAFCFPN